MSSITKQQMVVATGVVGGFAVGKMAYEHLFVEGLDDEERRNLAVMAASVLVGAGLVYLLGVDRKWVFVEDIGERINVPRPTEVFP